MTFKYLKIAFLLTMLFHFNLSAQSFSVTASDTILSDTLGSEMIFTFHVKNISQTELSLKFIRTKNDLPTEWSSSLCFEFCFAPHLDTIVTSAQFASSPLQPNEVREFSLHVFPLTVEGEASLSIKVSNENNEDEFQIFNLVANTNLTSIKLSKENIFGFQLNQNYPNPFNPSTRISFNIDNKSNGSLKLYDLLGNVVQTITEGTFGAGFHVIDFDGSKLSSGVYFYKLDINGFSQTKKMILGK